MNSFNFKSQICTTREQSDRLLSLGLKKETANCYLFEYEEGKYKIITESWLGLIADEGYYSQYKDVCIPAWSPLRLVEMMPPSIKDGYHYSLVYDIHRDAIEYICFANGGLQRPYNRLLWDTQSTDPFDNIICCIEWLIKEGCFNKEYLV